MLSMKHLIVTITIVLLAGCSEDVNTSADSETDKGSEMFLNVLLGKNPKTTYVIASPMEGVLMQNGQPLAHTKIIRSLNWTGRDEGRLEQEFTTDEQGRFSLPVHEEQLVLGKLTQFSCSSYIVVDMGEQRLDIWYSTKFEKEIYAESNGQKLNDLICDISNEEITVRPDVSSISTICRWEGMPEEH